MKKQLTEEEKEEIFGKLGSSHRGQGHAAMVILSIAAKVA
jgi:hypothetical protein